MTLTPTKERPLAAALTPHFLGEQQRALVNLADATIAAAVDESSHVADGLQEQIDDLHSFEGAGLVGIEDTGGHFTATTVEGALAELATTAAPFDPSASRTITGNWEFTQPLVTAALAASDILTDGFTLNLADLVMDRGLYTATFTTPSLTTNRTYTFPDATGTVALAGDIPAQVNITAGANVTVTGSYPNLTIAATAGGGIPDAPVDGKTYARKDADWEELIISGSGTVTSVATGTGLTGGPVTTSGTISLANMAQATIKGRASGGGTGAPQDLTPAQVRAILNVADGATANTGTVTSVNATGSTGLAVSGGPISTSGSLALTLSANLQSWSAITPASKANSNAVVATTGNQTGLTGNKSGTWTLTAATVADSSGDVRRTKHVVVTGSGNFTAAQLNGIVEKTNTSALTWTIPTGLGTAGDMITVSNQGSSGNITISRASGVSLYRNGSNANITVAPGSSVTIFRTSTSNRWGA